MRSEWIAYLPAVGLIALYVLRITADGIGGQFGVFWDDEGAYLLAAKNRVLFGSAHLFAGDRWQPELLAPFLHYAGLVFITKSESVLYIRLFIATCVICGAALIALLAGKRNAGGKEAVAAFVIILLNPVLYFYARIALSEGIQFFILTVIIALQFALYHADSRRRALGCAIAAGIGIACLDIAKISAVPASLGLVLGTLLCLWSNPRLTDKRLAVACLVLAVSATFALYFLPLIGAGQMEDWWRSNFDYNVVRRTPLGIWKAVEAFKFKLSDIAYYFTLMPIFALYLLALPIAAGRKKDFVSVLAVSTVTVIFIESFFGGELRRNFFSTSMLSIVAGFVWFEFMKDGGARTTPTPPARVAANVVVALHALGVVILIYASSLIGDTLYVVLGLVFLAILAIGFAATGKRYANVRKALAATVAVSALLPMLYQVFLAPNSREIANRNLENLVSEDAVIIGPISPWTFLGTKRPIVLTNCAFDDQYGIDFANDVDSVPLKGKSYLIINTVGRNCLPRDMNRYVQISRFSMLFPLNPGGLAANGSKAWSYDRPFTLYERR